ncbi:MAG: hypothetical protein CFE23_11670 [Flavobacterium sp. BFFFF1]|uniref:hypothetical protein n=1 Tax=unclassified Flavobacterium TaxID=196869 RepID=UPI000BCDF03B|nr:MULTISPECIES: hypothetical protein [unclassified Flavobacterium]OYU79907.1 MAG: hypothetical protein CFE23_11670 [Flavobacterium sp. BFFFF1]
MNKIYLILLFVSAAGFAQPRYAEIKTQQAIRPYYNKASHEVATTVLARAANSYEWVPVYQHDTIVKKFRNASAAGQKELERANAFGKKYLADVAAAAKNKDLPVIDTEIHER